MRYLFILLFLLSHLTGKTQITDSFSDNDFSQNPAWQGTTNHYTIVSQSLRSNGPNTNGDIQSDTLWLSTENNLIDSTEWTFLIDLKFNPTLDNFTRIYLVSDQQNLSQALNGYYIQLGQTGNDSINFFKQSGLVKQLIFTGKTSFSSSSTLKTKIRVKRDNAGNWQIFSDKTGGSNFIPEGNPFNDNTWNSTQWFGIYSQYKTDSRYNQFYYDDFSVLPVYIDTTKPQILEINPISLHSVEVKFDEAIDSGSSENIPNYQLDQALGQIIDIQYSTLSPNSVIILFSDPLQKGIAYSIGVTDISDLYGNICIPFLGTIYLPKPFDVVINEVMTDESPQPAGLPASDYLELYNRSQYPISLKGWSLKIKDDGSPITLDAIQLLPDSFIYFVSNSYIDSFQTTTGILPIGLSSLVINNESIIFVSDNFGDLIHWIDFTTDWYHDDTKSKGGWSLEQIDPQNPCGEIYNWKASFNTSGGTPGKKNSVYTSNPDQKAPFIQRACLLGNQTIQIEFSEIVYIYGSLNPNQITITPFIPVSTFFWSDKIQRKANIILADTIHPECIYSLQITVPFVDCAGNMLQTDNIVKFAFPYQPVTGEVIVNEVLFNPKDDGVDYVEIYNRSQRNLDLKALKLSSYKTNIQKLYQVNTISNSCEILYPKELALLATDTFTVQKQYSPPEKGKWIQMANFPTYSNEEGIVVICLSDSTIIDRLDYNDKMHFALLTSTEGVSLERINPEVKTSQRDNWHSASKSSNWGTPGYKNSQYSEFFYNEEPFTLSPDIFSPDNDGYNDLLSISYKFTDPGTMATITIYDERGNLVKKLSNNELLGTFGNINWDGTNDQFRKCKIGIYIILFEVHNLKGDTKRYKKTTVLGGKL